MNGVTGKSGDGSRVPAASIPAGARKTIDDIKEIASNHSDEEVYAMLRECSMDPNETCQKLLLQDTFHEVKRRRDKKNKAGKSVEKGKMPTESVSPRKEAKASTSTPSLPTGQPNGAIIIDHPPSSHTRTPKITTANLKEKESLPPLSNTTANNNKLKPKPSSPSAPTEKGGSDGSLPPAPVLGAGILAKPPSSSLLAAAVCSSTSDPVLVPTLDARSPRAAGTIRCPVGSQRNSGTSFTNRVADSNVNGSTNGTDSAQILVAPEETPTPKVILFENGCSSNSKSYSPLLATSNKGTTSNAAVNIKELDLEKVLEEQETHDLYCPNCNSCITRRVILKKRKRIAKDVKTDSRPEKLPNLGQIGTINEDLDGREQTNVLFKCLSCFSFFIPTECGFDIFHLFGGKKESIQIPSTTQTREEIQSTVATQTKEEIQSIATLETKEETKITVNKKASNQTSEANYNNWFTSLFQPGVNQKKVNQQDKVDDDPLKVVKERQKEIKKSDESQNIAVKQTTESVIEEQKTDAIAFSKVSTLTSASEITEIKEIETSDTKTNMAKMPGLSYIVTKKEDLIEVVNSVNVGTEIQEELKGPVQVTPTVPKETIIDMPNYRPRECFCPGINTNNWDILKPIVYGGLVETITGLCIVSSAASTGASTLNIVLLAAANIIGGLMLIIHDLSELKHAQDEADDRNRDELGRYWALLGRKGHFGLHATVAVISYIFFGLLPPLVYGFTFRKTDNSEYKLIAVAITSLVCIAILSIGKAHVRPRRTYFTTMLYYITIGVSASGLSYVAGMLLKQLIENLGLFDQGSLPAPSPPNIIGGTNLGVPSWASF